MSYMEVEKLEEYAAPEEEVQMLRDRVRNDGLNAVSQVHTDKQYKRVVNQMKPYKDVLLENADDPNNETEVYFYVFNKPFGVEVRMDRNPLGSAEELTEHVSKELGLDREYVDVVESTGSTVVVLKYDEDQHSDVWATFVEPGMVQHVKQIGGSLENYLANGKTVDEVFDAFDVNYRRNELRKGSLVHNTREKVEPGTWRRPDWV